MEWKQKLLTTFTHLKSKRHFSLWIAGFVFLLMFFLYDIVIDYANRQQIQAILEDIETIKRWKASQSSTPALENDKVRFFFVFLPPNAFCSIAKIYYIKYYILCSMVYVWKLVLSFLRSGGNLTVISLSNTCIEILLQCSLNLLTFLLRYIIATL